MAGLLITPNTVPSGTNADKIADGSVSNTEFQYLNGVTSPIQTQLDGKLDESFGLVSDTLSFTDQGSDVATPSAGFKNLYTKAAGLFYRISAGTVFKVATNPMTAGGDLIYGGASGVETRLANGNAGQILQSNGTTLAPTWVDKAVDSASRVNTPNGHGSTNNKIRRFTNVNLSTSDITYADSSTNGGSWTINTAGLYIVTYVDRTVTALTDRFGVSVNGSALTTDIASITYAQGYRAMSGATSTNEYSSVTVPLYLAVNDVVRAQTGGNINSTDTNSFFEVRRVL